MRTGPAVRAVLAAWSALLLAGCGSSGPTPQEWTDATCTAVLPFVRTAVEGPGLAPGADARQRALGDYLGRTTEALDRTLGDLDRLGPAPVDDGDVLAGNLAGGFGELRSAFSTAKGRVDALDPADPAAVERGLPGALEPVSRLGSVTGPLAHVTGNPDLAAAFRASPPCTDLTRLADATRARPPDGVTGTGPNGSNNEGGGG
ncbi:hypothetical protein H7X46_24115 [Pseudonocardia sp. C8]|uniref:hypothetical protein n=1 Tax=Pseudonocardia sp. C8 TaxID=2762759 RepID=UPI001643581E|nr:hypothetical protein [Pseudonocardia sp. C8]MBC3194143.1 hypothetical protein [Pseudonocardia sp. C8]